MHTDSIIDYLYRDWLCRRHDCDVLASIQHGQSDVSLCCANKGVREGRDVARACDRLDKDSELQVNW